MPQLVFRYDDGGEEVLSLDQDLIGVGRNPDNGIVIDHDYISGYHARFLREGDGGYRVFDLNSNNGTYVNDRVISEARLGHGDTIRFGIFEVAYLDVAAQPAPQPDGAAAPAWQESDAEILRIEAQRTALHHLLVEEHGKFEELKDRLIPGLEAVLATLQREIDALRFQQQTAAAEQETLQTRVRQLRESTEAAQREHDLRRAALTATVNELLAAEAARDEAKRDFEEIRAERATAEAATAQARREHEQLVTKNKAIVSAVQDAEESMASLRQRIAAETATQTDLERENEDLRQRAAQARDRLQMAEARVLGKIRDWNEFESNQLTQIVERKAKLEDQCAAAEARLNKARDELADLRERMRSESDGTSAALQELRLNHYEPTRELHEELTLRNEELANEIARKEQKLRQLEASILDSRETEQIVSSTLETKGQVLETLVQRIGEEYSRIAASIISLQRPATAQKPPRLADLEEVFVPKPGPPPLVPAGGNLSLRPMPGRTHLAVFDPTSQARSADFTQKLELEIADAPLPVGFIGLAAATRGSFSTSLARTVEANRPVLLVTSEELQDTYAQLKKLRAALPSQIILLGWKASTFVKVTESLHQGTNFQDLLAMLAISDGSLTTDPYMNTFFESLNQGKRFLYLPPALPWNPKPRGPHSARTGIYVDITAFQPDDPQADAFLQDLKQIVEATRQLLTIPEVSRARARRLQERLDLGPDWTRVIPVPEYGELLATLGKHLAVAVFEATAFDHPLLRDSLLAGTILLSPPSEAYQTFYPKLCASAAGRKFAAPVLIAELFDTPAQYESLIQEAEKTLLENHSYQAACRQLDTFMATLRR